MNNLIEIQRKLVALKGQFHKFGGYQYRSSEDILLALKPLLVEFEAILIVSDKIHCLGDNIYIEAVATIEIQDKKYTASSFARDGLIQKGMSAPQVTNSASSFAKKQALSNLFLIDDTTEIAPDQQEQEQTKKEKQEADELKEKSRKEWLDNCIKSIKNAQSEAELKGVYSKSYREASKVDQLSVNEITKAYQQAKKDGASGTI